VGILALAFIVAQVVSRGKSIVNRNFKHASLSAPKPNRAMAARYGELFIVSLIPVIPLDSAFAEM
jgi:hypothetical protein